MLKETHANMYGLGLFAKGLLSYESKEVFIQGAANSVTYRAFYDQINKGLFSTDATGELVNWTDEAALFLGTLHTSILDSVKGFRLAPVRTNLFVSDGVSFGIIGERQPLPLGGNVKRFFLDYIKTGAILPFTKEQLIDESGAAQSFLNRAMQAVLAGSSNKAFVQSVLTTDSNTITMPSLGETAENVALTLTSAFALLDLKPTSKLVLLVDLQTCASLAGKTDGNGTLAFPGVHATLGGEIVAGVQVFPVDADQLPELDSDGRFCFLFDADAILLNRGTIFLSRTESADIEMADAPDGMSPIISLFQADAVALKVVRTFAIEQIRNGVVRLAGVEW